MGILVPRPLRGSCTPTIVLRLARSEVLRRGTAMNSHADFPLDGSSIFWGEISPCEHIAQFYHTEAVFLDTLTGYIGGGLIASESTIVIATEPHLKALEQRLVGAGVDVARAILDERYIAMEAERALNKFVVSGWPDDYLFTEF